jgi:hypothetical protein
VLLRRYLNSRDVEARSNVQVERPPNTARSAERAHNGSRAREAGTHRSRSAPTPVRYSLVEVQTLNETASGRKCELPRVHSP